MGIFTKPQSTCSTYWLKGSLQIPRISERPSHSRTRGKNDHEAERRKRGKKGEQKQVGIVCGNIGRKKRGKGRKKRKHGNQEEKVRKEGWE